MRGDKKKLQGGRWNGVTRLEEEKESKDVYSIYFESKLQKLQTNDMVIKYWNTGKYSRKKYEKIKNEK